MNRKQIWVSLASGGFILLLTVVVHYSCAQFFTDELAGQVDINARDIYTGITPLMQAAIDSDYENAKLLLSKGADPNEVSATADLDIPLNYALINGGKIGSVAIAHLLMEAGADVNAFNSRGVAPIHMMMLVTQLDNRWNMLKELIAYGANINAQTIEDGSTMMHIAVTMNDVNWIDMVNAAYGQIINYGVRDHRGRTPMDLAIQLGHVSVPGTQSVQESLSRQPNLVGDDFDVRAMDAEHRTGLSLAVLRSDYHFAQVMIEKGADVNQADDFGNTPLHYAMRSSEPVAFVRLLLGAGARVNSINRHGRTPLQELYKLSTPAIREQVATLLLQAGSPVSNKDVWGKNSIDMARQRRDKKLLELISRSSQRKPL